jgi:hypothetical protein
MQDQSVVAAVLALRYMFSCATPSPLAKLTKGSVRRSRSRMAIAGCLVLFQAAVLALCFGALGADMTANISAIYFNMTVQHFAPVNLTRYRFARFMGHHECRLVLANQLRANQCCGRLVASDAFTIRQSAASRSTGSISHLNAARGW